MYQQFQPEHLFAQIDHLQQDSHHPGAAASRGLTFTDQKSKDRRRSTVTKQPTKLLLNQSQPT